MKVIYTKQHAAEKLAAWLRHEITQEQLVAWAEGDPRG